MSTGHSRKSDAHDAISVAVAALGARRLGQVRIDDHTSVLRLLSERRDDLVRQRTRTLNRLLVLLADLLPGGAKCSLDADTAAALLRRLRPATAPARTRRQLAVDLVADLRALDRRVRRPKTASGTPSTGQQPISSSCSASADSGRQAPGRGRRHPPLRHHLHLLAG